MNKSTPRMMWLRRLLCRIFGCITRGSYYGMPQAHCRRCGKKTVYGNKDCAEYDEPWGW